MTTTRPDFQTRLLRRCRDDGEFDVYRAALEWSLVDPIVIESRDDFKSEYRWRDKLEPFHHQVTNLITFCRRLPVTLLADDVGLGKTISAGLVASELIARSRIGKILIVCPKLLGPQWKDELQSKFDIPAEIATGSKLISADPGDLGAIITTYASARSHLEKLPDERFDMLILDEAHKLRNLYGVDPPPQVAVRFRKALEARRFRYVLMLTATPIQNRLWDLYSLVDLLTAARGHENPFGSEGAFARKFIDDPRDNARRLKPEAREEFRNIVYGYMSRVRRGDVKLSFPDRVVQLHRVKPTQAELDLIDLIAKPIQKLNRLAQISILQALTSSPQALAAQLRTMAVKGTVPAELAAAVNAIASSMTTSAKLRGVGELVSRLREENPSGWRMVIFTGRLETQTSIQLFLEQLGIPVGIINGSSGQRNQDTIKRFREKPDRCRVIVSTEAGSEGVNLQVANVLVNYDLPWNPMIVEQRIGRVQRLASDHESVSILNITLRGTFEEYIVGRLMEKLQMASHAIGDIEALLEATGVDDGDEDEEAGFDERIRQLVVAALAQKDVKEATERALASIEQARMELEREQKNIEEMLGGMDGAEYVGPRAPKLPMAERSMDSKEFVLAALKSLGAAVTRHSDELYVAEQNRCREYVRFSDEVTGSAAKAPLYRPGAPAFQRLADKVIASGVHRVRDSDKEPRVAAEAIARSWVGGFGGWPLRTEIEDVERHFTGTALVRARATVAHDSYERLIDIPCRLDDHRAWMGRDAIGPLPANIENPGALGLNVEKVADAARLDDAISEFCRFYLERREQEVRAAGSDARKRKKLEDDFTPGLAMSLVAIDGDMSRALRVRAHFAIDGDVEYSSSLLVVPGTGELLDTPPLRRCDVSGMEAPADCLARCEMSGQTALKHRLVRSDISGRHALAEHTLQCSVTGKRLLTDEAALSDLTGNVLSRDIVKTSALSGKSGEPAHFGTCDFTGVEVLKSELAVSEVSRKRYRTDQTGRSEVSGTTGHRSEFIQCYETRQAILPDEAERCAVTGQLVRPGILERCAVSGRAVLPGELERCAVTGRKALKTHLVTSSVSGVRLLEDAAIRSAYGKHCAPPETRMCVWSGRRVHPDDLRTCVLLGLPVHFEFTTAQNGPRLQALAELLDGIKRTADCTDDWTFIESRIAAELGVKRCKVEAAELSADQRHLAMCAEVRTMLGLKVQHAGLLYSLADDTIVGRIAVGKRGASGWQEARKPSPARNSAARPL